MGLFHEILDQGQMDFPWADALCEVQFPLPVQPQNILEDPRRAVEEELSVHRGHSGCRKKHTQKIQLVPGRIGSQFDHVESCGPICAQFDHVDQLALSWTTWTNRHSV